jgi:hypothetical protein
VGDFVVEDCRKGIVLAGVDQDGRRREVSGRVLFLDMA